MHFEFLQEYYSKIDTDKALQYERAKQKRLSLMQKFMRDKDGVYHDYKYTDGTQSEVYACACFVPYMVGIAQDGIEVLVEKLATEWGFAACEDMHIDGCQWGYPYVWAPHQYFAFKGLKRVGKHELAKKHGARFLKIVEDTFAKTGTLWERYEANGVAKSVEYQTQVMLGWTAGVYNVFYDEIKRNKEAFNKK